MACGPEITGGGPGGREPPRDEPRDPKRKKEKPREVKILWNSSAKPGTGEAYRPSGVLLNSFDLGGLWPGNNRGGPGGREPPGMSREAPKGKRKSQGRSRYCEIAQSSLKDYPGRRSRRCRLRCPKRKQEKPREVKILWNSSAEPGPKPHKSATARPPPRLGGLWPVARK